MITTNAMDLPVGANVVWTDTTGPGKGFTKRMITNPDGDIAEDRAVTAAGSYSANPALSSAGPWLMHLVAFREAGSSTPTPTPSPSPTPAPFPTPTSSISLAWNADAPTGDPNTNTVGYRVYTGLSSGNYTQVTDVGNATTVTVPTQSGSTYFFVVAAYNYNSAGIDSPYSNEVSVTAP
jgi:hypothetical protein